MRSFVRFSHTDHDCESAALLSLSDRFLNIAATIQVISCARCGMCGCSVDCCAFLYDSPRTMLSLYEVLFSLDVFLSVFWTQECNQPCCGFCFLAVAVPPQLLFCDECV